MFCRQHGGYLMSHTGTCASLAVVQSWHLLWKVTAAKCNVHLAQTTWHTCVKQALPFLRTCKMSPSRVLPVRILSHPALNVTLAPPSLESPVVDEGASISVDKLRTSWLAWCPACAVSTQIVAVPWETQEGTRDSPWRRQTEMHTSAQPLTLSPGVLFYL